MNTITIVGTLGRDLELKFSNSGTAWATGSVAVSRKVKEEEVTTWFNIKLFGSMAENAVNSFKKGNRVICVGRIDIRSYETDNGEKRNATELIVDEIGASVRWAMTDIKPVSSGAPKTENRQFVDEPW